VSVLDHLRHPAWPRRALFGLGLLLALTIIIRLVLDPIAAHFTHKQLNASEAVSGDFESVHVTLLPPGYGIRRLKIIEAQVGDWRHPLFYAEHARVTLDWRRLLHAELAARLRLDGPKMVMTATGGKLKIPDRPRTIFRRPASPITRPFEGWDLTRMTCFAKRPRERIIPSSVVVSGASMALPVRNRMGGDYLFQSKASRLRGARE